MPYGDKRGASKKTLGTIIGTSTRGRRTHTILSTTGQRSVGKRQNSCSSLGAIAGQLSAVHEREPSPRGDQGGPSNPATPGEGGQAGGTAARDDEVRANMKSAATVSSKPVGAAFSDGEPNTGSRPRLREESEHLDSADDETAGPPRCAGAGPSTRSDPGGR